MSQQLKANLEKVGCPLKRKDAHPHALSLAREPVSRNTEVSLAVTPSFIPESVNDLGVFPVFPGFY